MNCPLFFGTLQSFLYFKYFIRLGLPEVLYIISGSVYGGLGCYT